MIDLSKVRAVLLDCQALVDELDGQVHGDSDLFEQLPGSQKRHAARQAQVERSKAMLLLTDRLQLAAALVANEYWFARGEMDPLDPDREEDTDGDRPEAEG